MSLLNLQLNCFNYVAINKMISVKLQQNDFCEAPMIIIAKKLQLIIHLSSNLKALSS